MHYSVEIEGRRTVAVRALVVLLLAGVTCVCSGCLDTDSRSPSLPATDLSSITRPFSYGKNPGTATPRVAVVSAEDFPQLADQRFGRGMDALEAQPFAQTDYARSFVSRNYQFARVANYWNAGANPGSHTSTARSSDQGLARSAALYLDRPFGSLMASLFKQNPDSASGRGNAAASNPKDEAPNPFTDAKQKVDSAAPPAPPASAKPAPAGNDTTPKPPDTPKPADSGDSTAPPVAVGPNSPSGPRFTFLGDIDGTGTLKASSADRIDLNTFAFSDGNRVFSLYINPGAVENQRSFGIEDLNGDGIPDLLVTARAAIFGGVLRGSGDGSYWLSDTFLTGYAPIVATAGPMQNGFREILSVNLKTGSATVFRATDRYRRVATQTMTNSDYISHLVETQTGSDFVLASRDHQLPRVYRWRDNGSLDSTTMTLATEPTVSASENYLQDGVMGGVEAYQVGSYASVLLSNGHGQSFNVATMSVTPQVFLAIGDLSGHGTLDVAVAYLLETTPKN